MIWTVVQARLGSSRLPRKILYPLGERQLIDHVVDRAAQLGPPVCLAIPEGDQELARVCIGRGWVYFEGPEDDVLTRYVECARQLRASHVVRVTADCPFLDVEAGRWTIQSHLESGADFTQYVAEGRGIEVFTRAALEDSGGRATTGFFREHIDEWVLSNPWRYTINTVKFSVDTEEDLDLARRRARSD